MGQLIDLGIKFLMVITFLAFLASTINMTSKIKATVSKNSMQRPSVFSAVMSVMYFIGCIMILSIMFVLMGIGGKAII